MELNIIQDLLILLLRQDIFLEVPMYPVGQHQPPKQLGFTNNSIINNIIQVNTKLSNNMNNNGKCSTYKICSVTMEIMVTIWVLPLQLVLLV